MKDKKLEDLYSYKGKELFLREMSGHKQLNVFMFGYLYVFLFLYLYILNNSYLIDLNFIDKYVNLNIGEGNTFFNDLKNSSLYLFAAQATLIGLIFPVVIAYVSLANVGRASSDKLMNVYKIHTGFNFLANSSFVLMGVYAFLFVFDSFFNIFLFKVSQFFFLLWFILNIYLMYVFLSKTVDFIYGSKKIEEIIKFSYNNEDGVRDGFLIILDDLRYYIENKSISRVEELEVSLVDFLDIIYLKHDLKQNDLKFFVSEIRILIDGTLDYGDAHAIRKLLYIYYYIGGRLVKEKGSEYLKILLEMHHIVLFDLSNKLNVSDDFKKYVYHKFLDSWSSWRYVAKDNSSKIYYVYYTFMIILNSLHNNKNLERVIDIFLNIPFGVRVDFMGENKFKVFSKNSDVCDQSLLNFCVDAKFCLIKCIVESDIELSCKKEYIESLLKNASLLSGASAIYSDTVIQSVSDLVFSLLRVIPDSFYNNYLNKMLDESKISARFVNRQYWMDTSSYLSKMTESYAYVYEQLKFKVDHFSMEVRNHLKELDINFKNILLDGFDRYLNELNNIEFSCALFDTKKRLYIKKRYVDLMVLVREVISDDIKEYYSKITLSELDKGNVFFIEFSAIYRSLQMGMFSDLIRWKDRLSCCCSIKVSYDFDFIPPDLMLDYNFVFLSEYDDYLDSILLGRILNENAVNKIRCYNPILQMLNFVPMENKDKYICLVFSDSFFKDVRSLGLGVVGLGFNQFLVDDVNFRLFRGVETNFYGAIFNRELIESIDFLNGNSIFSNCNLKLVESSIKRFGLICSISFEVMYKINLKSEFSIFVFLESNDLNFNNISYADCMG